MRVLVGIQVSRHKAGIEDTSDLLDQLIVNPNLPQRDGANQLRNRRRKSWRSHQHQMAADIERRRFLSQADRVVERVSSGHQRCRRQDSEAMRIYDSGIDVAREAEVVGIDD